MAPQVVKVSPSNTIKDWHGPEGHFFFCICPPLVVDKTVGNECIRMMLETEKIAYGNHP